jgi:hypothetical protein
LGRVLEGQRFLVATGTCEHSDIRKVRTSLTHTLAIAIRVTGPASQRLGRVLEGRRFPVATARNSDVPVAGKLALVLVSLQVDDVAFCHLTDRMRKPALAGYCGLAPEVADWHFTLLDGSSALGAKRTCGDLQDDLNAP